MKNENQKIKEEAEKFISLVRKNIDKIDLEDTEVAIQVGKMAIIKYAIGINHSIGFFGLRKLINSSAKATDRKRSYRIKYQYLKNIIGFDGRFDGNVK